VIGWKIRDAGRQDLDALLALWEGACAPATVSDNVRPLVELLAFDPHAIVLADAESTVVGSVIAAWNGWRGSFYRLAVMPQHRRLGLATALVREGERRLRERGALRLDAIVTADDAAAMGFWAAAGYRPQDDRTRFVRNL
jgi:ribosomal protein S18 acetylase RimI-like enzyme